MIKLITCLYTFMKQDIPVAGVQKKKAVYYDRLCAPLGNKTHLKKENKSR